MKITADIIKAAVASYYRYKKQYPMVAFEMDSALKSYVNGELADILIVGSDRYLIEVEVKISLADLRKDKGKSKHRHFQRDDGIMPTRYFFFALPQTLANEAYLLCDNMFTYAGVLGVAGSSQDQVYSYRRARQLNADRLPKKLVINMVRSQSATICRLATKVSELKEELRRNGSK